MMNGTDCPIKHFELMKSVASYLRSVDVQMLEQEYHYRTFGSWSFVIQIKGDNFRIVWDGRDGELLLNSDEGYKAPFGYEWIDWLTVPISRDSTADIFDEIKKLVETARQTRLA